MEFLASPFVLWATALFGLAVTTMALYLMNTFLRVQGSKLSSAMGWSLGAKALGGAITTVFAFVSLIGHGYTGILDPGFQTVLRLVVFFTMAVTAVNLTNEIAKVEHRPSPFHAPIDFLKCMWEGVRDFATRNRG